MIYSTDDDSIHLIRLFIGVIYLYVGTDDEKTPAKKSKIVAYKPPADIAKHITKDEANRKLWDEAMTHASEGKQVFLAQIQEIFACICCQDLVHQPVTTECKHNFGKVSGRAYYIL